MAQLLRIVAVLLLLGSFTWSQEAPLDPARPASLSIDDITNRVAVQEEQFKQAFADYGYRQTIKVQTLDGNKVDGEYLFVRKFSFESNGQPFTRSVSGPISTLKRILVTKEDIEAIDGVALFALTPSSLSAYRVTYVGQQQEDGVKCYVFDVTPLPTATDSRLFHGRIWVDETTSTIVKSHGKTLQDVTHGKKQENLIPSFTARRKLTDGLFWFPVSLAADETLRFARGSVRVLETVTYEDYQRLRAHPKPDSDSR